MAEASYGGPSPRIGAIAPGRGLIGGAMGAPAQQKPKPVKPNPNLIQVRAHTRLKRKKGK